MRFKLDGDSLVNVRSGTDEADIVMISVLDLLAGLLVQTFEHLEEFQVEYTESKLATERMQMVAM